MQPESGRKVVFGLFAIVRTMHSLVTGRGAPAALDAFHITGLVDVAASGRWSDIGLDCQ